MPPREPVENAFSIPVEFTFHRPQRLLHGILTSRPGAVVHARAARRGVAERGAAPVASPAGRSG
eukprot:1198350-Prymnesium_polylepis.3